MLSSVLGLEHSVGNAILYGVTALGTLAAAFATDGTAEIGLIAVELATATWLVEDSIKCVEEGSYAEEAERLW